MTCKEKQVCIECGDYKNCPYVSRNLEHKCQHLSDIMYGFELGYKDATDKAFDWLIERYENQGVILLDDIYELKQRMEEQQ